MAYKDATVKRETPQRGKRYYVISVVVDPEQYHEIRRIANKSPRQSMSSLARRAIDRFLKDVRYGTI